ncbi:CCR4-Not complex component, Not1-domain-containing protein [Phascolomyces articulosus]|uniref:General negative regulator of transcription subunit 1 n=1 Tax=Phascolomyces articulosus TaxID=60185 RepID=A0AAD5KE18_9FUNG|nr:CCR4-Not complex component, Not1-domain-containing protein [Phascolomyces articulosus]
MNDKGGIIEKPPSSSTSALGTRLLNAGKVCCDSVDSIQNILNGLKVTEKDIGQTLAVMSRSQNERDTKAPMYGWNVQNFVTATTEVTPGLDWYKVIENLDCEDFFLYDPEGLNVLVHAWQCSPEKQHPFPVDKFFDKWKNVKGQVSALYRITSAPTSLVDVSASSKRKIVDMEDFKSCSRETRSMALQLVQSQLNSLDLIECVLNLGEDNPTEDVQLFLDMLLHQSPELIFLGLIQIQPIKQSLHATLLKQLLMHYLTGSPSSSLVLAKAQQGNPDLLRQGFVEKYNNDPKSLTRIMDIVMDLQIFPDIMGDLPFFMAMDMAALASRRQHLNLAKWLYETLLSGKEGLVRAAIEFLDQKVVAEQKRNDPNTPLTTIPLSLDTVATFLKIISECQLDPTEQGLLKEVQAKSFRVYPDLANAGIQLDMNTISAGATSTTATGASSSGGGPTSAATEESHAVSPEIESEANEYYVQLYSGTLTMDQMIDLLMRFSSSSVKHENDVYKCIIHNILDEYHFFTKYPDKELSITANLFGAMIQNRLMPPTALSIALRLVIDALQNHEPGSKMSNFGIQALLRFKGQIPEWPDYCQQLLQIKYLEQASPDLVQFIRRALQQQPQQDSNNSNGVSATAAVGAQPTMPDNNAVRGGKGLSITGAGNGDERSVPDPVFTALYVPEVPYDGTNDYTTPDESIQDKILFIINNIARDNFESKLDDLKQQLEISFYQWFSDYLVVKRASIEPNYHELYLLLLDALESPLLYRHVLRETYVNIKILLNSAKTATSSNERSLLKNLGAWLGGLTLAKNRPIKQKNVSFKDLLLEGYDNKRLIVVIPFVCKVLEQGAKSRVFRPPNPWLMAVLKLLVELYHSADLRLNLKFEIEVLCKSLNVELDEIEPTSLLHAERPKQKAVSVAGRLGEHNLAATPGKLIAASSVHTAGSDAEAGLSSQAEPELSTMLAEIAPYITFNSQINMYSTEPDLRRMVVQSIIQSIREVVNAIVERSVSIAALSTRDIVAKDFALDPDEEKMREAAHMMVSGLASGFAIVTCKESLKPTLVSGLLAVFVHHGIADALAEQAALVTAADNMELACVVVERVTIHKAKTQVDRALMESYTTRRNHREQRPDQTFIDPEYASMARYVARLPPPLRITPGGVQPGYLGVYEEFARLPRIKSVNNTGNDGLVDNQSGMDHYSSPGPMTPGGNISHTGRYDTLSMQQGSQGGPANSAQIIERTAHLVAELSILTNQFHLPSFDALPAQHDIRLIIREILLMVMSSYDKADIVRELAQQLMHLLYRSETQLAIETHVVLLDRLCEISPEVAQQVKAWIGRADDERKFVLPVTLALIKGGMIHLPDYDRELARLVEQGHASATDYTARLVHATLFAEPPLATRQDMIASLEALSRIRNPAPDSVKLLMNELRQLTAIERSEYEASIREQFRVQFVDWVKHCQLAGSTEQSRQAFIIQLFDQGIFKNGGNSDTVALFFRIAIETSIEHAMRQMDKDTNKVSVYIPTDALAKLIVGYSQLLVESSNEHYDLTQFLSVIIVVLARYHEARQQQFDQRPFMRLFVSLLNEYHHSSDTLCITALSAIGNVLYVVQPRHFPGFTFAWFQLISHRMFMPKLLLTENQAGWSLFHRLLISGLQFMSPYLSTELRDTTRLLYRGTLRMLLVLLHDFPEFLCDYHQSFCDVIPASCMQLRNLVLSAFPRNMRLPDPFTPQLKVDLLPEIRLEPHILSDYAAALEPGNFKEQIDEYLKTQTPSNFLNTICDQLRTGDEYDVTKINAFVFYVGLDGIGKQTQVHQSIHWKTLEQVLVELDPEGRYLYLGAIANQLRYPNSHTHYFSCVLLSLFKESDDEFIKEQITRVLLERLIVNRPHPWGLLITFIELMKNPCYKFWEYKFVRCATDIERLFETTYTPRLYSTLQPITTTPT